VTTVPLRHIFQYLGLPRLSLFLIVKELVKVVIIGQSGYADGGMNFQGRYIIEIIWICHSEVWVLVSWIDAVQAGVCPLGWY
jgi:hypothetical protein